jgi:sugar-specific transcriptional regulator TrmB
MDFLEDLRALGFTEYEAKVYLTLLRINPATGYELSKRSGVPRSMVYEALGRLEGRGAVLKAVEQRSTLYRPVPPEVLIDRFAQDYNRHIQKLREGLAGLYDAPEEDRLWSISDRESILSYAAQMIRQAGEEILFILSDRDLEALRQEIEAACQRGLNIQALLTGEGDLKCDQVARHPPLESELQQLTDMLVVVADGHTVLIAASADRRPTATVASNPNLVMIARQFIWMELFAQRIYTRLGSDLLARIDPGDRRILESFVIPETTGG